MDNQIFVRLDVDNAGDRIEFALLSSDYEEAQKVHNNIQDNINLIMGEIQSDNSITILMKGCDDILFSVAKNKFDLELLEKLKRQFKANSEFSLSIGFGSSVIECMLNLRIAKVSGKDRVVGEL